MSWVCSFAQHGLVHYSEDRSGRGMWRPSPAWPHCSGTENPVFCIWSLGARVNLACGDNDDKWSPIPPEPDLLDNFCDTSEV
jgi:hypothetical protein